MPSEYIPHSDEALLNSLGYKQELKREFSIFELFSVAFSIMSLVPSISSVFVDGALAGGVGLTWGWFVPCIFILSTGISMGELGSAYPTSGGLYYWTFKMASPKLKRPLSFLCAYANSLGLIGGVCSIDYGFANILLSIPYFGEHMSFMPTRFQTYGVLAAVIVAQSCLNLLPSNYLARVQAFATILNLILVALVCIAVPIGAKHRGILNSGKFVFTDRTNLYEGYSYFGGFLLSWLAPVWVIGAFDSCVHMAEEASNATTAVPIGIVMAISLCAVLGFCVTSILTACIKGGDFTAIVGTASGLPVSQIIYDSLGREWTIGIMTIMALASFLMGSSLITAASRQIFSVARDGVMPMSRWVRQINPNTSVPYAAIVFIAILAILISLLVIVDEYGTAANALFSLAASSNSLAWLLPVLMRVCFRDFPFTPGPFYIGKWPSLINNIITIVFLVFIIFVLTMLPQTKPVDETSMNYTVVINCAVWIGSMLYYFLSARHWFNGPVVTFVDPEYQIEDSADKQADGSADPESSDSEKERAYTTSVIGIGM